MYKRITKPSVLFSMLFASGKKLALTALCSVLIASAALAQDASQEQQPPDQQAQPQAEESPDKPGPSSNFTVTDNEIVFTAPASGYYLRDIRLQNNNGGLRFYGAGVLTEVPNGAAIQFFGNNSQFFPGQLFLDSGASNSAALIFRTAPAGGTIAERMRVTPRGLVGVGTPIEVPGGRVPQERFTAATFAGDSIPDAIWGFSSVADGTGVIGQADNGANAYGVWGVSSSGFAGSFEGKVEIRGNGSNPGNLNVTGTLTKGGGSFKIDHPLDPENKYLSHSFVESPDMMNIYNGNVVLDAKGQAVVTLPAWFDALNREFRYQLTAIGAPGPNLYIAEEITGNWFKIAGGKRGMKVSWQVTGIRQDAYANVHRIQVEEHKPVAERGTYLHPEAFGQSAEKGIKRAHHPAPLRQRKEESTLNSSSK